MRVGSQQGKGRIRPRTGLLLLVATCLGCFAFAVIHTCRLLYGQYGTPQLKTSVEPAPTGYRVAGNHVAWHSKNAQQRQRSWLSIWLHQPKQRVSQQEALALQAKAAAKAAMEEELKTQVKVKAALERQERKHKALVKELEATGWRLSVKDRASRSSLRRGRDQLATYLASHAFHRDRSAQVQSMSSRGIVIAAGGPVNLANAYIALHTLRNVHGCRLPVEIYHNGPNELDATTRRTLQEEFRDVACIDIAGYTLPQHQILATAGHVLSTQQSGWVLKALMLYVTNFQEVLVLDADNLPLADPSFLFDCPEYLSGGNLFWPDFWSRHWHNPGPVYELLNLTEPWEAQPDLLTTESGQFMLDRRKHVEVLEWVMFLNLHADTLYSIMWGDKDTYRLAFALAGEEPNFSQVEHPPANALHAGEMPFELPDGGVQDGKSGLPDRKVQDGKSALPMDEAYTHGGMVQMDPSGSMLFLHRTAGSKLDPRLEYPANYTPAAFVTPQLTPRQAAQIHISGPMFVEKFDLIQAEDCTAVVPLNLVATVEACNLMDKPSSGLGELRFVRQPPIPLFRIAAFERMAATLEESMRVFRRLQRRFRSRELLLGTPKPAV